MKLFGFRKNWSRHKPNYENIFIRASLPCSTEGVRTRKQPTVALTGTAYIEAFAQCDRCVWNLSASNALTDWSASQAIRAAPGAQGQISMQTLMYFLIWGAFIFVMMRFGCGAHVMGHGLTQRNTSGQPPKNMEKNNVALVFGPLYNFFAARS